jgi:hypothetical protein
LPSVIFLARDFARDSAAGLGAWPLGPHGIQGRCMRLELAGAKHLADAIGTQYAGISETVWLDEFHADPERLRAACRRRRMLA